MVRFGDVLLFKPQKNDIISNAIAFFSGNGQYCHSARYIGNRKIVESVNDKYCQGVRVREIKYEEFEFIDVFYLPYLSVKELCKIIDWEKSKVGSGYDLEAFPSTFFHSVLGKFFNNKDYQKQKPLINNSSKFYCSELQATSFFEVLGIEICYNVHHSCVTPKNLGQDSLLVKRR